MVGGGKGEDSKARSTRMTILGTMGFTSRPSGLSTASSVFYKTSLSQGQVVPARDKSCQTLGRVKTSWIIRLKLQLSQEDVKVSGRQIPVG